MAHRPISRGSETILSLPLLAMIALAGPLPPNVFLDGERGQLNGRLADLAAVARLKFGVLYEEAGSIDPGLGGTGIVRPPLAFTVAREEQGALGL